MSRLGRAYRSPDEVIRRGVFLPDGKVQCATCHDARSPWMHYIALPPGSKAVPLVNRRDARTRVATELAAASANGERVAVEATPLCLACHAKD